eukprot:3648183-Rhodomonas_salina.1
MRRQGRLLLMLPHTTGVQQGQGTKVENERRDLKAELLEREMKAAAASARGSTTGNSVASSGAIHSDLSLHQYPPFLFRLIFLACSLAGARTTKTHPALLPAVPVDVQARLQRMSNAAGVFLPADIGDRGPPQALMDNDGKDADDIVAADVSDDSSDDDEVGGRDSGADA